jgi:nitroimidazol reductase NimA-like FMN-containing flavoprotein (pyridoxamine 5'-phosphate oxidase superfamily)
MKDKNWLHRMPLHECEPLLVDHDEAAEPAEPAELAESARAMERLDDETALTLLATAPYGRIVFLRDGEPEIRPLAHIVDGGEVIVRTRLTAALAEEIEGADGLRATFEADHVDLDRRQGWSVIVSGTAEIVEPDRQARCKAMLRTMLAATDDTCIAIRPKKVSGIRIVPVSARPMTTETPA